MKKIVISHPLYKPGMDALEGKAELIVPNNGDSDQIINTLKDADGFILRIGKIDAKAIDACPNLKVITRPGVGVDNVDVFAATKRGIPVVICPATNHNAVAEHALTLIMACAKNLTESHNETCKGNFAVRNKYSATEFGGKTVFIIGFGNIGKTLAKFCKALGMNVLAYDPFVADDTVKELGCSPIKSVDDGLACADFVSLHMPSLPETKNMISHHQLSLMKKSAFLINCARGDIVDEQALCDALKNDLIKGAGLDVLKDEPMPANHPLMEFPNVIITPHMAAQTQETTEKTVLMAAEGTLAVLEGKQWPYVANKEVYEHPIWKK